MSTEKKRIPKASRAMSKGMRSSLAARPRAEIRPTTLIGGFPDSIVVTLRYAARFTLTSSVAPASYTFWGNGLWDPDFTGTGGQPNNFDDWTAQYNRYKVLSSRARLTAVNTSSSANIFTFGARQGSGSPALDDFSSEPRSITRWNTSTAGAPREQVLAFSSAEMFGLSQTEFEGQELLNGAYNSNPGHGWYWTVTQASFDNSTSSTSYYEIIIDYRVQFMDRIDENLDLVSRISRLQKMLDRRIERLKKKEKGTQPKEESKDSSQAPGKAPAGKSPASDDFELIKIPLRRFQ